MKHDNEKQGNLFKGDSSHGPEITLQTPVQTAFNVIKTIVGAGIFCTAYGFHLSGFYFGMFLVIIMAFIFHWTIMTFIHASVRSETENVQDLLRYCFGVPGVVVLNISLLILEIGGIAAFTGMNYLT